MKSRVAWIDMVKYICIMWVMLSHLEARTDVLASFYLPFFLNGFFFAAGYVYKNGDKFGVFLKKKIKGLLVPWLFFSVLNIVLSHLITFNEHGVLFEELKWNFLQIRGMGDGIWFVAALFMAFLPFYFIIYAYELKKIKTLEILIVSFLLSVMSDIYVRYMDPNVLPWRSAQLPWHLEYIFVAMFWMVIGYIFKNKLEEQFDRNINAKVKVLACVLYFMIVYSSWLHSVGINKKIDAIIYSYLSAFVGVFCLIWISKLMKPNRYFLYIGRNTLICFALHGKIYSLIETLLKKFAGEVYSNIQGNVFASSCFAIIFTFVISLILIGPIFVINEWFPFLIGRNKKADKIK